MDQLIDAVNFVHKLKINNTYMVYIVYRLSSIYIE